MKTKHPKLIATGHLIDKNTHKPARLENLCPFLGCTSQPEEKPNCIPNYEDCMVYKFQTQENGFNPLNSTLEGQAESINGFALDTSFQNSACPYFTYCNVSKLTGRNCGQGKNDYTNCQSFKMVKKYQDESLVRFER